MNNPHLEPLELNNAQAQERLALAQAQLAETKQELIESTPIEIPPQKRREAIDALCAALRKPWPLALGILALSPLHAGGLWMAVQTRRLMRNSDTDEIPSLESLPRKADGESATAFLCVTFVLGLLIALTILSWCRDSGVDQLWFVSFYEANLLVGSVGLPAGIATLILGSTLGTVLLVTIASKVMGLNSLEGDEALVMGSIISGLSFLLVLITGIVLGGLIAEHGITLWLFAIPAFLHAFVYLRAALKRTKLNEARIRRDFEKWAERGDEDRDGSLEEIRAKVLAAQEEARLAQEQAGLAQGTYKAEMQRWAALSRVEQLQELQLLKNIEATQTQITAQLLTAEAAQREADAAEYAARSQVKAAAQASQFSAQQAAAAAREKREADKVAKDAARPVCRHCGTVEPRMSVQCFRSPTGYHVLLR